MTNQKSQSSRQDRESSAIFRSEITRNNNTAHDVAADHRYLRTDQASAYCAISPATLRRWVRRRMIPCYRPSQRCTLYKISDLDAALSKFKLAARA